MECQPMRDKSEYIAHSNRSHVANPTTIEVAMVGIFLTRSNNPITILIIKKTIRNVSIHLIETCARGNIWNVFVQFKGCHLRNLKTWRKPNIHVKTKACAVDIQRKWLPFIRITILSISPFLTVITHSIHSYRDISK